MPAGEHCWHGYGSPPQGAYVRAVHDAHHGVDLGTGKRELGPAITQLNPKVVLLTGCTVRDHPEFLKDKSQTTLAHPLCEATHMQLRTATRSVRPLNLAVAEGERLPATHLFAGCLDAELDAAARAAVDARILAG